MKKIEVLALNAKDKFIDWINNRGGVIIWADQNMSTMGGNMFTPALTEDGTEYLKPKYSYTKNRIVNDINEFKFVKEFKVFKTLRIATRIGSTGLYVKLTDASSHKVRKACGEALNKYGVEPTYEYGGDDGKDCYIKVPVFDEG